MPDFSNWVDVATVVGGFATAFAAAFAIVGVPLVVFQVREARKIEREATAKNLYRQYLEDSISRPDLIVPDLDKLQSEGRLVQYELFIAHMLYSLEEVLENTRGEAWRDVVRGQLRRHVDYLGSETFKPKRAYYSRQLIKVLDQVLRR